MVVEMVSEQACACILEAVNPVNRINSNRYRVLKGFMVRYFKWFEKTVIHRIYWIQTILGLILQWGYTVNSKTNVIAIILISNSC
jgi:hypothetical protein